MKNTPTQMPNLSDSGSSTSQGKPRGVGFTCRVSLLAVALLAAPILTGCGTMGSGISNQDGMQAVGVIGSAVASPNAPFNTNPAGSMRQLGAIGLFLDVLGL